MTAAAELKSGTDYRALRRSKLNATLILAATVVVYFAAPLLPIAPIWIRLLQSAGEAGLVGGLADWFAITALFRHPLGLPIPHTALIPARKNQIGRSLARFVEEYFVDESLLIAIVRREDRARQIGDWLSSETTARTIAKSVAHTLQTVAGKSGHMSLVDLALPFLKQILGNFEGNLEESIAKITGRFVPGTVDKMLAGRVARELDRLIDSWGTPGSQDRRDLDIWIQSRLVDMQDNWRGPVAKVAREFNSADLVASFGSGAPPAELIDALSDLVTRAGRAITESEEGRKLINRGIENTLTEYIVPFRKQITGYIEGVVNDWDAGKITGAIEMQVGKDLQFIRINGTLIGALIGVLLFAAGQLLGVR
jgi:uncharacterized membrane-anchored protein YjiN (DUF445 family)